MQARKRKLLKIRVLEVNGILRVMLVFKYNFLQLTSYKTEAFVII